jgi:phosphopantothenoylcysteine decarboxylase/phosphopantothenate--cysteine ligase
MVLIRLGFAMVRILITSGPTRQYIDPVRYLSNASSGMMGRCLAEAAIELGHQVVIVSGPVQIQYPAEARVVNVISTDEMLAACIAEYQDCAGVIGAAAPCDYQPVEIADHKIRKTGQALLIKLVETTDVMAALGMEKQAHQWSVGFALETEDARFRALSKLQRKCCDLVVLNGVAAIDSADNCVEIIEPSGNVIETSTGSKSHVAKAIMATVAERLID